jgi:DNA transformation protein
MRSIEQLPNLGPASAKMLRAAGIGDEAELRALESVEAFKRVRQAGMAPSLNLLSAIEGALTGQRWDELSLDERMKLDVAVNFRR